MSNEINVTGSETFANNREGVIKVLPGPNATPSTPQHIPVILTHAVIVKGASNAAGAAKRIQTGFEDAVGGRA